MLKVIAISIVLVTASITTTAKSAKPAPEFITQVKILSVIQANIDYCKQSSEGVKLSSKEYAKFNEVTIRAYSIIEKIQKKI